MGWRLLGFSDFPLDRMHMHRYLCVSCAMCPVCIVRLPECVTREGALSKSCSRSPSNNLLGSVREPFFSSSLSCPGLCRSASGGACAVFAWSGESGTCPDRLAFRTASPVSGCVATYTYTYIRTSAYSTYTVALRESIEMFAQHPAPPRCDSPTGCDVDSRDAPAHLSTFRICSMFDVRQSDHMYRICMFKLTFDKSGGADITSTDTPGQARRTIAVQGPVR